MVVPWHNHGYTVVIPSCFGVITFFYFLTIKHDKIDHGTMVLHRRIPFHLHNMHILGEGLCVRPARKAGLSADCGIENLAGATLTLQVRTNGRSVLIRHVNS